MSYLFGRQAQILVGVPGQTGLSIDKLRVKFHVEKTSESSANKATISIYNLSDSHRSIVEGQGAYDDGIWTPGASTITLQVGYLGIGKNDSTLGVLCTGSINKVSSERQENDIVTIIECLDGGMALREAVCNTSFGAGKQVSAVVDYLAKLMAAKYGLTYNKPTFLFDDQYVSGIVLSGSIKDHLDKILPKINMVWSIQNNSIMISPPKNINSSKAVEISAETGMIGIPIKRELSMTETDPSAGQPTKIITGIEVISLINPLIMPGATIRVISKKANYLNGEYQVKRAEYDGDTLEGQWQVKVETMQ